MQEYNGCVLVQNLDRSRFARRARSSPVKKDAQIFLVVVSVVILFSSAQSAADHSHFFEQTTPAPGSTDRHG